MMTRPPEGERFTFYGSPAWNRMPWWRRFLARWWWLIVLVLWVIFFSGCVADGRTASVDPSQDVHVHVTNNNWLDVTVYTWINGQTSRLGNVTTANEETFVLPRALAEHAHLRFLLDLVGSNVTYLTPEVFAAWDQEIVITVENNIRLSTVIVR